MTNCDPSKPRSQNGQSSFLRGTKQPIKPDKKSRIHRPNFSSSSRFLASAESDFPDWFLVFSRLICWAFSPGEGLEVGQGKCQSHRELTLWWKGHNLKIVYSTSLYHHTSHANASSHCFYTCCCFQCFINSPISSSFVLLKLHSDVPGKYWSCEIVSIWDELFRACIINRKWE